MAEEITLNIEGMTCDHCVMRITKALKAISGVKNVKVNLENNNAQLTYDPNVTSPNEMIEVIVDTGYQATS